MAIQPTNAGIDFQQRVSAFMMILMEFDIELDAVLGIGLKDKIQKLNFEASDKIDDLVMTTSTNRKIYMQMKRNISLSSDLDSEFYGVCNQFVRQFLEENPEDVAYVLVARTQASNSISIKLKRILDGIRLANSINIEANLNKTEISILEKFKENIDYAYKCATEESISEDVLKRIISKVYIEVFDIEDGESFERNVKLILHSRLNVDVELFWRMLISTAIQYGANKNCLDKESLHKHIKGYINSQDKTGGLSELQWEEQGAGVSVKKDCVIALGNAEINKKIGVKDEDKETILIMELYRFAEGKKKETLQYIAPNIMKWGDDISFEILFRCSSKSRIEKYIDDGGLEKYNTENSKVIVFPVNDDGRESDMEILHKDLICKSIKSQKECKCINCGKAIYEKEVYLIEIDNVECSNKAGFIHKECLRPIDRVLGICMMPEANQYSYLKNFDINLWIKLIMKGKQAWGNIGGLEEDIVHFMIDTDEVFTDGKYCVRTLLSDGTFHYATNRGVIHRMTRSDAEQFAKQLVERYRDAKQMKNPFCYTSETYVYGPYEYLVAQMGVKEELLECVSAEVVIYNEMIAKMYNESETYYAPIIYLCVEGEPVIINGAFPLITNPLKLNYYLENWKSAGIILENYEVNIISEDNDFILKVLSLILNGVRPIVDMLIGIDGKLIKGCMIYTMKELEIMHSEDKQMV